ncbi:MAG: autoinducer binding domain-containing protein [Granulosicoccus sp.]
MTCELNDYAEALDSAPDLETAFRLLEKQAEKLGFDGVLYTYIPSIIVKNEITSQPVYQVSSDYAPAYLSHYQEARFDRHDPLISAVRDGCSVPIDWAGDVCENYMQRDKKSREVIDVARNYGIEHGITLPLMSSEQGIAGASFITRERYGFNKLFDERLQHLKVATSLYSNFVLANTGYLSSFVKPIFANLNELEIRLLAALALGKCSAEIASELCRSEKYLEQVMLKMRRKVSGVEPHDKPTINRNQLLYYAGQVNILSYAEKL